MSVLTIDLGTTNTKVTTFGKTLEVLYSESVPVEYFHDEEFYEIDPVKYMNNIIEMINSCAQYSDKEHIDQIIITGQAETLVVIDSDCKPLMPMISWLDKRSVSECYELSGKFKNKCYEITGQPEFIPTWPVTKILWLKRHSAEVFEKAAYYLLLKDYVIYCLTGQIVTDYTIAGFSCYFDIFNKKWWKEIIDYIGIQKKQLPKILMPNEIVGPIRQEFYSKNIDENTKINSGLLDHFAGMIGTGNISKGTVNESAGTVLSLAIFVDKPIKGSNIPIYCGPFPNTYVLLPVCESGGICLEWFKNEFIKDCSYKDIDNQITSHIIKNKKNPIFLPYIAGTNAPLFNDKIKGVFFGITTANTKLDFALAIMKGVGCLLRENIEFLEKNGVRIEKIISTGGGAKSNIWPQIKSDFTQKEIFIPENPEATSLGAAILAAVHCNYFEKIEDAILKCVTIKNSYNPKSIKDANNYYNLYQKILNSLNQSFVDYNKMQ